MTAGLGTQKNTTKGEKVEVFMGGATSSSASSPQPFYFVLIRVHPTVCCIPSLISIATITFILVGPVSLFVLLVFLLILVVPADEGIYPKYSFSLLF